MQYLRDVPLIFTAHVENASVPGEDDDIEFDAVVVCVNRREIARSTYTDYLHSSSPSDVSEVAAIVLERLLR